MTESNKQHDAMAAEAVGEAGAMPGTDGFTMAAFRAADVPIGTKLYVAPQPAQADARGEDAYVAKRLSEVLASVYATLIGDDEADADESLNAIERVERAAQVLRLEVELYRGQADARVGLTAAARATIMDACQSISRNADGVKAGCAIGDEWPDAEDKAFYDAELRLLARLVALLNDSGQSEPETATVARIEQLRKALFESRDAMRVMSNWAKKPDPAGHSWAVRMVDRANAALNGEPEPRSEVMDAVRDVLDELHRQIDAEGWTPAHDDEHDKCEMALAAHPGQPEPIDMLLFCPKCGAQHVDAPEKASDDRPVLYADAWTNPPHRSHLCHACGTVWRPADVPTNGVAAIQTSGKADTWSGQPVLRAEVTDEPSLTNPLTPYGMLVRALRIVSGTTLMDMADALLTTPAKLSAMEFDREPVTPEFAFEVAAYFDAIGVLHTASALRAAAARTGGQ